MDIMIGQKYVRENGHNYMYREMDTSVIHENDFRIEMIRRNRPEPFLPFTVFWEDGKAFCRYEINGLQTWKEYRSLGTFDRTFTENLLLAISRILETADCYLIDREMVDFDSCDIYIDPADGEIRFCFCPDRPADVSKSLRKLVEELMKELSEDDRESEELLFGFYKRLIRKNLQPDEIRRYVQGIVPREETEPIEAVSEWSEPEVMEEENSEPENFEKRTLFAFLSGIFKRKKDAQDQYRETSYEKETNVSGPMISSSVGKTEYLYVEENDEKAYLSEEKTGKKILLETCPFLIGSHRTNHYAVTGSGISRYHLKIEEDKGCYFVMDLNSTNGTKVDGIMLAPNERKRLQRGAKIDLPGVSFRFFDAGA